jgi:hypothetical protein
MELHSQQRFPWGTVVWGCVAAGLLIASLASGNSHLAILALAPALLAFGLLAGRRREFHAWLRDDCLELEKPAVKIPYAEIEGLTMGGFAVDPDAPRLRPGTLVVTHRGGVAEIPATVNAPIQKVYQAILAVLPTTGSCRLSDTFSAHFQKEVALFGQERVHGFGRRKVIGRRPSTRRGQICAASLLFCGILWCLIYAAVSGSPDARKYEPWLGFGIALSIFSFLGWLLLYLMQRPLEGKAGTIKNAELIVSPTGIAVHQGDIRGHLRWEELRDVRVSRAGRSGFVASSEGVAFGMQLVIAGAKIHIADVYDRPLALIYKLIQRYWKPTA